MSPKGLFADTDKTADEQPDEINDGVDMHAMRNRGFNYLDGVAFWKL